MTWICTIQLLAPALILFFATCTTVLVTIHNKLQMNKGKIEALLFNPSKSSDLPNILKIWQVTWCFLRPVKHYINIRANKNWPK